MAGPALSLFGIDLVGLAIIMITYVSLYLALSLSLNFELGFTGIPNFGKALFVGAGATFGGSFSGLLSSWYLQIGFGKFISDNTSVASQINSALAHNFAFSMVLLFSSLAVAGLVGAAFGYAISFVGRRLKEVYLAMAFFAFAQFFQVFAQNFSPLAGGSLGILVADPYAWAGDNRFLAATAALTIFAAVTFAYYQRMSRSPLGRVLRAVRDNPAAAEASGKNLVSIRTRVIVVSSVVSAMVGALYGFYTADVQGGSFGNTLWTFWPWVIVVMGGAANNFGVLGGAIVFWGLLEAIDIAKFSFSGIIPFNVVWLQYLLVGTLLLLVLRLRPGGIFREGASVTLRRAEVEGMLGEERAPARRAEEEKVK